MFVSYLTTNNNKQMDEWNSVLTSTTSFYHLLIFQQATYDGDYMMKDVIILYGSMIH